MRPGIALRPDYDAAQLWALAKATRDAGQSRRLLALAEIYDGGSRTKAARIGGVGYRRFGTGLCGLSPAARRLDRWQGSREHLQAERQPAPGLGDIVERGPMPAIHGVMRWRLKDLTLWVWEEFQISLSETTLGRELRALGYRKLSARPATMPGGLDLRRVEGPGTNEVNETALRQVREQLAVTRVSPRCSRRAIRPRNGQPSALAIAAGSSAAPLSAFLRSSSTWSDTARAGCRGGTGGGSGRHRVGSEHKVLQQALAGDVLGQALHALADQCGARSREPR